MIIKLKNNPIFKLRQPLEIEKSQELQTRIEETWNKFIEGKVGFFNGDVYSLTDIKNENDQYTLEIGKAKFADLVYAKQNTDLIMRSLFSSIILKTKDDYYVLIRNNHGVINSIGGMASNEDLENNTFNPEKCLERELKEEIGLSLNDKNAFLEYAPTYLKIPHEQVNMYPCGVVFTGKINYTKEELENHFNKVKDKLDSEIKELIFYTNKTYLNLNNEPNKKDYLIEVIELMIKETNDNN